MINLTIAQIADACHGTFVGDKALLDQKISGVAIDSRKVEPGFLFVPFKGAKVDGHTFIPQVMEKGALITLSEDDPENATYPYIKVESSLTALQQIAAYYRNTLDLKVVGITGSVGKTSTKEMIASVLAQKYHILKTQGNHNNEIGMPLTIFELTEEHEVAVLEMGIDHFGEMHALASIGQPDVGVFTNIGISHMEILGNRDGIMKAKTEMFDHLKPGASVILNGDDDKLCTIQSVNGTKPVFYGLSAENDTIYATDIEDLGLRGSNCTMHLPDGTIQVHITIPGRHMIYNALAGACVGLALGLTNTEIKSGIEALKTIPGRVNLIDTGDILIIDDCYNASPASMQGTLDILTSADGRKVAVMGDMFELGTGEEDRHYEMGAYASNHGIDVVCCIGNLSAHTCRGAKEAAAGNEVYYFETKADFFQEMNHIIKKGDTVMVKASNGMKFPEIVEKLKGDGS